MNIAILIYIFARKYTRYEFYLHLTYKFIKSALDPAEIRRQSIHEWIYTILIMQIQGFRDGFDLTYKIYTIYFTKTFKIIKYG